MDDHYIAEPDSMARVAAVCRRLYSQRRMDGDAMRNSAQMLETVLERCNYPVLGVHATYDERIK